MKSERDFIFGIIEAECQNQDQKWGEQNHDTGTWRLILDEELGEVAEAFLEGKKDEFMGELIQCAAVLIQWINCESKKETK